MKYTVLTHCLSAAGTLRQMFGKVKPEWETRVFASYDEYSHGPLPLSGASRDFFLQRQAFWQSLDLYDADAAHDFDLTDEHISLVEEIKASDLVEICVSDSVQDVFYAAVTLRLLADDGVDITGILARYFGGCQVKWGLGALRLEEMEDLYGASNAEPLDAQLFGDLCRAVSQGSGEAVRNFINERNTAPVFVKALSSYLLRFPQFNGGLGSIDRALLGAGTDQMKKSAYTIGSAMAKGMPEHDHIGDLILFKRLVELCGVTPDPWFRFEGDPRRMRSCSVRLTESGLKARARYSVQVL